MTSHHEGYALLLSFALSLALSMCSESVLCFLKVTREQQ